MSGLWVWHALVLAAVVLLLVAVIVTFAVIAARSRRGGNPMTVVSITLSLAAIWAVIAVIGAAVVTATTLLQDDIAITVPVLPFWPEPPAGAEFEGMTATRVGGGFTTADLVATGLSTGVRVCWALGQALTWLVPGTIAALIAVACFQLLAGRIFTSVVVRMATVTAIVVTVGGVAAQVLNDVAGAMAASEILTWTSGTYPDVAGTDGSLDPTAWMPTATLNITIPFWPIAAGLAFAALAAIFRYGARLQRDTEGLV